MARRVEEDSGVDEARLRLLANRLLAVAPRGRWWPYEDPFEVALSAVLVQRTRWEGAARAMANLGDAGLLTPRALARAPRARLEGCLRSAGFYRQKARALQGIAQTLEGRYGGSIERAFAGRAGAVRHELLSWPGVGEETADAILVFAAGRPGLIVDAYTLRIMERYGVLRGGTARDREGLRRAWRRAGPRSARRSRALHAALVEVGKAHCRRTAVCGGCPLKATCLRAGVGAPRAPVSSR